MSCECESCVNHREVWNENQISFPVEYEQIFQKEFKNILATDQPDPIPNSSTPIADLVLEDIKTRKQLGLERYGVPLQAHNKRNALRDAYEEAIDLVLYLRQALEESTKK